MPITPVLNTKSFIVFEIAVTNGTLRLEVEGRKLGFDADSGRITSGTISSIKRFEYASDIEAGNGRSWGRIDLPVAALNTLLGNADWNIPTPGTSAFNTMMAALPATAVVTAFSAATNLITGSVVADYLFGTAKNDDASGNGGNDRIWGRQGNDELNGNAGDDRLFGESGDDSLYGGDDNDLLDAGAGANSLYGGNGNDKLKNGNDGAVMHGDAGNDVIVSGAGADDQRGGTGNDYLIGGAGDDTQFGGNDDDRIYGGDDDDTVNGGSGDDQLYGGLGMDSLNGGDGNDKLEGNEGNDELTGGNGHDELAGGGGDDVIQMELGNDTVNGGAGADSFIFDAATAGAKLFVGFASADDELIFNQFSGDAPSGYQYFLQHAENVGKNVVFVDGDLTVTFHRTQLSAFSVDNFGTPDLGGGGDGGGDIIG